MPGRGGLPGSYRDAVEEHAHVAEEGDGELEDRGPVQGEVEGNLPVGSRRHVRRLYDARRQRPSRGLRDRETDERAPPGPCRAKPHGNLVAACGEEAARGILPG